MRTATVIFFLAISQVINAQNTDSSSTSIEATKELRKLIEESFFTSLEINARSTVDAIQKFCDLIGEKQSVKDEKKLLFILSDSPNTPLNSTFKTEMQSGSKAFEAFCKHYGFRYQFDQGAVYLFSDTSQDSFLSAREEISNIKLENISISSKPLPHALRSLLKPHGLSFSILHPEKSDSTLPNPLLLQDYSIGIYRKSNTDLMTVLTDLSAMTNSDLWISPEEILFLPKGSSFTREIKSSNNKK